MSKLSPGPWSVRLSDNGVFIDAAGYAIAQMFGLRGYEDGKAIAKVPEMVRLLRLTDHRCIRERTMQGLFGGPDDECPGENGGRLKPCLGCQVAALLKDLPEEP